MYTNGAKGNTLISHFLHTNSCPVVEGSLIRTFRDGVYLLTFKCLKLKYSKFDNFLQIFVKVVYSCFLNYENTWGKYIDQYMHV